MTWDLIQDQALALAVQMAGALDSAHRKEITHRDLKPANVMLTRSGAKLLDFGLAGIEKPRAAGAEEDTPGTILGTFRYMAPERAPRAPKAGTIHIWMTDTWWPTPRTNRQI